MFGWGALNPFCLFSRGKKSSIASLSIPHGSACVVDLKSFSGKGSDDGLTVTFNVCKGIFKLFFLFYKLFTELSSSQIQFLGMAERVSTLCFQLEDTVLLIGTLLGSILNFEAPPLGAPMIKTT